MGGVPLAAADQRIDVPSGLDVAFHDRVRDDTYGAGTYRFRFVAPAIASGETDFEAVMGDMEFLCATFALPRAVGGDPPAERIVISLMSEVTPYGVANPEVTQFFESFAVDQGVCDWEAF